MSKLTPCTRQKCRKLCAENARLRDALDEIASLATIECVQMARIAEKALDADDEITKQRKIRR